MNRNEWIKREFRIPFDANAATINYVEKILLEYKNREKKRGWQASNIEKLSDHTWLEDLKDEDPLDEENPLSPTIVKWCKENCEGGWHANNPVWWEFELETDAMAFKLAWGD